MAFQKEATIVKSEPHTRSFWIRALDWLKRVYQYSALALAILCLLVGIASIAILGPNQGGWLCIGLGVFWGLMYFGLSRLNILSWRRKGKKS